MKKEELIVILGKENIGWWTGERIATVILLIATGLFAYGRFALNFAPAELGLALSAIFGLMAGVTSLINGRKVFETNLDVKGIQCLGTCEVSGNDGKDHRIEFDDISEVKLNKGQRPSFVKFTYRTKNPEIKLVVGGDINEIWR